MAQHQGAALLSEFELLEGAHAEQHLVAFHAGSDQCRHLAQLDIAKLQSDIAAQEASVDKLHNGERPEVVRQAQANYASAQAAANNAERLYQRQQQIFDTVQGVSRQELDNALYDRNAKAQAAEAARQTMEEVRSAMGFY